MMASGNSRDLTKSGNGGEGGGSQEKLVLDDSESCFDLITLWPKKLSFVRGNFKSRFWVLNSFRTESSGGIESWYRANTFNARQIELYCSVENWKSKFQSIPKENEQDYFERYMTRRMRAILEDARAYSKKDEVNDSKLYLRPNWDEASQKYFFTAHARVDIPANSYVAHYGGSLELVNLQEALDFCQDKLNDVMMFMFPYDYVALVYYWQARVKSERRIIRGHPSPDQAFFIKSFRRNTNKNLDRIYMSSFIKYPEEGQVPNVLPIMVQDPDVSDKGKRNFFVFITLNQPIKQGDPLICVPWWEMSTWAKKALKLKGEPLFSGPEYSPLTENVLKELEEIAERTPVRPGRRSGESGDGKDSEYESSEAQSGSEVRRVARPSTPMVSKRTRSKFKVDAPLLLPARTRSKPVKTKAVEPLEPEQPKRTREKRSETPEIDVPPAVEQVDPPSPEALEIDIPPFVEQAEPPSPAGSDDSTRTAIVPRGAEGEGAGLRSPLRLAVVKDERQSPSPSKSTPPSSGENRLPSVTPPSSPAHQAQPIVTARPGGILNLENLDYPQFQPVVVLKKTLPPLPPSARTYTDEIKARQAERDAQVVVIPGKNKSATEVQKEAEPERLPQISTGSPARPRTTPPFESPRASPQKSPIRIIRANGDHIIPGSPEEFKISMGFAIQPDSPQMKLQEYKRSPTREETHRGRKESKPDFFERRAQTQYYKYASRGTKASDARALGLIPRLIADPKERKKALEGTPSWDELVSSAVSPPVDHVLWERPMLKIPPGLQELPLPGQPRVRIEPALPPGFDLSRGIEVFTSSPHTEIREKQNAFHARFQKIDNQLAIRYKTASLSSTFGIPTSRDVINMDKIYFILYDSEVHLDEEKLGVLVRDWFLPQPVKDELEINVNRERALRKGFTEANWKEEVKLLKKFCKDYHGCVDGYELINASLEDIITALVELRDRTDRRRRDKVTKGVALFCVIFPAIYVGSKFLPKGSINLVELNILFNNYLGERMGSPQSVFPAKYICWATGNAAPLLKDDPGVSLLMFHPTPCGCAATGKQYILMLKGTLKQILLEQNSKKEQLGVTDILHVAVRLVYNQSFVYPHTRFFKDANTKPSFTLDGDHLSMFLHVNPALAVPDILPVEEPAAIALHIFAVYDEEYDTFFPQICSAVQRLCNVFLAEQFSMDHRVTDFADLRDVWINSCMLGHERGLDTLLLFVSTPDGDEHSFKMGEAAFQVYYVDLLRAARANWPKLTKIIVFGGHGRGFELSRTVNTGNFNGTEKLLTAGARSVEFELASMTSFPPRYADYRKKHVCSLTPLASLLLKNQDKKLLETNTDEVARRLYNRKNEKPVHTQDGAIEHLRLLRDNIKLLHSKQKHLIFTDKNDKKGQEFKETYRSSPLLRCSLNFFSTERTKVCEKLPADQPVMRLPPRPHSSPEPLLERGPEQVIRTSQARFHRCIQKLEGMVERIEINTRRPRLSGLKCTIPPNVLQKLNQALAAFENLDPLVRGTQFLGYEDLDGVQTNIWLTNSFIMSYAHLIRERNSADPNLRNIVLLEAQLFWFEGDLSDHIGHQNETLDLLRDLTSLVVIPIIENENHWTFATFDAMTNTFTYYNSRKGWPHSNQFIQRALEILKTYYGVLQTGVRVPRVGRAYPDIDNAKVVKAKLTMEKNDHDCGVFTLQNMEMVTRGEKPHMNPSAAHSFRCLMVLELLLNRLIPRNY